MQPIDRACPAIFYMLALLGYPLGLAEAIGCLCQAFGDERQETFEGS